MTTTSYFQIEHMLMEMMQKNFFIREAETLMDMASGRMHNDLYSMVEKMKAERDKLKKRIYDAQYPEN